MREDGHGSLSTLHPPSVPQTIIVAGFLCLIPNTLYAHASMYLEISLLHFIQTENSVHAVLYHAFYFK